MTARRQSLDPLERYDTPRWVTRALLDRYSFILDMDVLEPCAGSGAISKVLSDEGRCNVLSYDIAPRAEGVLQADALLPDFWRTADVGGRVLCTNPPFSLASALIRYGLKYHARAVVMLLRLTWLEATADRFDIPDPTGLIVVPRPQFTGRSGDSCTVAWMIWQRHVPHVGIVRVSRAQKAIYERDPLVQSVDASTGVSAEILSSEAPQAHASAKNKTGSPSFLTEESA